MENKIHKLRKNAQKIGLEMNADRTEIMSINNTTAAVAKLDQADVERVPNFMYLGHKLEEINRWLSKRCYNYPFNISIKTE